MMTSLSLNSLESKQSVESVNHAENARAKYSNTIRNARKCKMQSKVGVVFNERMMWMLHGARDQRAAPSYSICGRGGGGGGGGRAGPGRAPAVVLMSLQRVRARHPL